MSFPAPRSGDRDDKIGVNCWRRNTCESLPANAGQPAFDAPDRQGGARAGRLGVAGLDPRRARRIEAVAPAL